MSVEWIAMSLLQSKQSLCEQFPGHWRASTADSNLTLHGFRRFKTTHLINLRYLESEISEIDHLLYQLVLGLDLPPSETDRLGLKYCRRDKNVPSLDETLSEQLVQKVRYLLKEYDEAVIAFSNIMSMDTFSLLDDGKQCKFRTDLTLQEMFKTRLLRIDQVSRKRQDPLQRSVHKLLRLLRYLRMSKSDLDDVEGANRFNGGRLWSSQNTALMADITSRIIIAAVTTVFLTIPLAALSNETRKNIQVAVVSVCIIMFACLVSVALRASNLEMRIVSAAYAAIVSVFVSNSSTSK